MAEPDWALWQSILQQLRGDMTEVRRTLATHSERLTHIDDHLGELSFQSKHTLGSATGTDIKSSAANRRSVETGKRLDELTARVEELEKTH